MGIFSNKVASAAGSIERNDRPSIGKVIVLMEEAKFILAANNRSKKDFFKARCSVVKGIVDADGLEESEEDYRGNRTGDVVDLFYMDNPQYPEFFVNDLQKFGLTCLGADKTDLITEAQEAEGIEGITHGAFEDEFLPMILGIDAEGESIAKGMCDGATFIEVKTTFKPHKKGETDEKGNLKGIVNSVATRKVSAAEVAEGLSDKMIVRLFGSQENFLALIDAESAE
tara:strand:- start:2761 stop:3441 length:681 start_codon:yes stop_codon:yes gene_type:complete